MAASRPHKRACHSCGGAMSDGQLSRQTLEEELSRRRDDELDSTYAHLRAVVENCKHSSVAAIRHQLVGLLPEVQTYDAAEAGQMRSKGLGDLVDRRAELARLAWKEFGYGDIDLPEPGDTVRKGGG